MLRFIVRRLLGAIPTLLIIIIMAFFLMRMAKGGPFDQERKLPPEIEKNILAAYDLDKPLLQQFVDVNGMVCRAFISGDHQGMAAEAAKAGLKYDGEKYVNDQGRQTRCFGGYLGKLMVGDFGPSYKYKDFTVAELIKDGAVGDLQGVFVWGNRQLRQPGYRPALGTPPSTLHYDQWIGPSPYHPYNPEYFSGKAGANCLQWNMFWDFGTGQIGDMGAHTMDLAWNALDAGLPTSIEAKGDPFNPDVTPVELTAHFNHPANDWRPAIRVSWYQGGALPTAPKPWIDLNKIGHGAMFKGSKGLLVADFNSRMLIPAADSSDLTYYKTRKPEEVTPPIGNFQEEWLNACKGNLQTSCNFDYNGLMTEQMALGLVAYRAGKKLDYDGKAGVVTNAPEANAFLKRPYRDGWPING
jgi:hypothetical protein